MEKPNFLKWEENINKAKVGDVELSDDSDEIEVVVGAAKLLTVNLAAK